MKPIKPRQERPLVVPAKQWGDFHAQPVTRAGATLVEKERQQMAKNSEALKGTWSNMLEVGK